MGRSKADPIGPPWYLDLCDGWRRHLARRGRSSATLRIYGTLMRDFGRHLLHCRVEHAEDLIPAVLYTWQDGLLERVGRSMQASAASVLRGLLRWGARESYGVPQGLWERVDAVERDEGLPRPLEEAARDALLRHFAGHDRGLEQLRDRALFLFLLTSGSRISAALRLNRDDVRGAGAIVVQKGGREHRILISPIARGWLEQYLRARGRDDEPALWIRVGERGRHRLTIAGANEIWTDVARRAHVARFTSHVIKHTTATEMGHLTESDQEIADHIGWRNTQMMRRYRQIGDPRREELVAQIDWLVPAPDPEPAARRRRPRVRVLRGPADRRRQRG